MTPVEQAVVRATSSSSCRASVTSSSTRTPTGSSSAHNRPGRPGDRAPLGVRRRRGLAVGAPAGKATTRTSTSTTSWPVPTVGGRAPGERPVTGNFVVEPPVEPPPWSRSPRRRTRPRRPPAAERPARRQRRQRRWRRGGGGDDSTLPGRPSRSTPTTRRPDEGGQDRRAGVGRPGDGGGARRDHRAVERKRDGRPPTGRDSAPRPMLKWSGYPIAAPARRPAGESAPAAGVATARSLYRVDPAASAAARRTSRAGG